MYSSSLSDLKKSTVVDESSSKTSTRCSVPENTNQLQDALGTTCMYNINSLYASMLYVDGKAL